MKIEQLEGVWSVIYTNFPMWLKGDKIRPTFTYITEERNGILGLKDEVNYLSNGKIKSIIGWDESLNKDNTSFMWRGEGLKSIITSNWEIIYTAENLDWLIIHFEKTLFTPEGYDVISKNKTPNENEITAIHNKLRELDLMDKLTSLLLSSHE